MGIKPLRNADILLAQYERDIRTGEEGGKGRWVGMTGLERKGGWAERPGSTGDRVQMSKKNHL